MIPVPRSVRILHQILVTLILVGFCLLAAQNALDQSSLHGFFRVIWNGSAPTTFHPASAGLLLIWFVVPGLASTILLNRIMPQSPWTLRMGLGVGVCLAIGGLTFFVSMLFLRAVWVVWLIDLLVLLGVHYFVARPQPGEPTAPTTIARAGMEKLAIPLKLLMLVSIVVSGLYVIHDLRETPQGLFDANHFWIPRATALSTGDWHAAYCENIGCPDYPPLWTSVLARGFAGVGWPDPLVSHLICVAVFAGLMLVVYGAVVQRRGDAAACLAVITTLTWAFFVHLGGSQFADTLISLFLVGSLVTLEEFPIVSGVLMGFAAATKNEGFMMALATLACVALLSPKSLRGFLGGLTIPLIFVVAVKILSPGFSSYAQPINEIPGYLRDVDRYSLLGNYSWGFLMTPRNMALPLFMVLVALRGPKSPSTPLASLALITVGYYAIWLTSNSDLEWNLEVTYDWRLAQVWPGFVVAYWLFDGSTDYRAWSMKASRPQ